MLSKKRVTKLLDKDFRQQIISSVNWNGKFKDKKILPYCKHVVDSQLASRSKAFVDNKNAFYGFSPICPLYAVLHDGTVDMRLIEFNIVNHFLRVADKDSAVEVVICMLIEWCKEDKHIKDFDIDAIEKALAHVEHEHFAKKQHAQKECMQDAVKTST